MPKWRTVLIEWPARIVDGLWRAYWTFVAALSIVCLTTVALALLAYMLGFRFGW